MALIDCQECKGPVSDRASACPKCGMPLRTAQDSTHILGDSLKFVAIPIVGLLFTWVEWTAKERDTTVRQLIDLYDRAASTNMTDQFVALHASMDFSQSQLLDKRALGAVRVLLATTSHTNVVQRAGEICQRHMEEARLHHRSSKEIVELGEEVLLARRRFGRPAPPMEQASEGQTNAASGAVETLSQDAPDAALRDIDLQVASLVGKTVTPEDSADAREKGARLLQMVAETTASGTTKSRLTAQASLLRSPSQTPVFLVSPTTNMQLALSLSNALESIGFTATGSRRYYR